MGKPKHRPVGAYLPVGQLDGDCACGRGAYPCPDTPHFDDDGRHLGYCNACGEEAEIGQECCETGEVVQYEDDEADF